MYPPQQVNYSPHQYFPPQPQQFRCMPYKPPRGSFYQGNNPRFQRNQTNCQSHADQHWCETCDRGFPSLDMLENHKRQHQKCNIDGCQFVAHPKVITKHIQMQHSTGIFKKIANLKNPEDIKKWIEERKKKYPTKENVEKKAAEVKAKMERGEKMGLPYDRRNNRSGPDHKRKQQFDNNNYKNKRQKFANFKNPQTDKTDSTNTTLPKENVNRNKKKPQKRENVLPVVDQRHLKPFTGIKNLLKEFIDNSTEDNTNIPIEDDSDVEEQAISEPKICAALTSLISNYESSDEDTKPTLEPILKSKPPVQEKENPSKVDNSTQEPIQVSTKNEIKDNDDDSGPEEVKVEKVQPETPQEESTMKSTKPDKRSDWSQKNTRNSNFKRPKPKLPSTLLRKLLHKEIKQERNIILQCVRHIVKNNYFNTK